MRQDQTGIGAGETHGVNDAAYVNGHCHTWQDHGQQHCGLENLLETQVSAADGISRGQC